MSAPRSHLAGTLAALIALDPLAVAGAAEGVGQGTLEVRMTDHREAIGDFARLELVVGSLAIHAAGEPRRTGWLDLTPTASRLDLTQVTEGRHAVVFVGPAPARGYDAIRLQARLGEVTHRAGRPIRLKADLSPVFLRFRVEAASRTVATLDVVLLDLSDHPERGYELHIKQARAEGPS